jgi:hypothetical protein
MAGGKNASRSEASEFGSESRPNSLSCLQGYELIRDNPQQALKTWIGMPKRRQGVPVHHRCKSRLDGDKPGDRLFEILLSFEALHRTCLTFARFDRKTCA